jgi:hypothetical protein
MQTKNQITISATTLPVVEDHISSLEEELIVDFGTHQAKTDGLRKALLTEPEFKVNHNYCQVRAQAAIDLIRNLMLPGSSYFAAKDAESTSTRECEVLDIEIDQKEKHLKPLLKQESTIPPAEIGMSSDRLLLICGGVCGSGDAGLCFLGFFQAGYNFLLALIAAVSVGMVTAFSHYGYSKWIMTSKTQLGKFLKSVVVLGLAFTLFAYIAHLRVEAANQVIDTSVPDGTANLDIHISKWGIAIISFLLFGAVFVMALALWKSKAQKTEQKEHARLRELISKSQSEIKQLKKLKEDKKVNAESLKNEARHTFEYCNKAIDRVISIADVALATYKLNYAKYHGSVPDFFNNLEGFVFDDSLSLITDKTITE